MSLFNQLIRGERDYGAKEEAMSLGGRIVKRRTFKEQINDEIASHQARIKELQEVLDSLSPEVERFVEAVQKIS